MKALRPTPLAALPLLGTLLCSACQQDAAAPAAAHSILAASASLSFSSPLDPSGGRSVGATALDVADLDGDGLPDVGAFSSRGLDWFQATADRTQWDRRSLPLPAGTAGFLGAAKFGDVDGDGTPDLVLSSDYKDRANIHWLSNPGGAAATDRNAWTIHSIATGLPLSHINDMQLADLDSDGKLDVAVRSLSPNQLHLFSKTARTTGRAR